MKLSILYFISLLLFARCQGKADIDIDKITGKYKTTAFMQPAPGDSFLDLNSIGAFMELNLNTDSSFNLLLFIPDNKKLNLHETKMEFSGKFSIDGDIIKFSDSGFALMDNKVWIYDKGKISIREKINNRNIDINFSLISQ